MTENNTKKTLTLKIDRKVSIPSNASGIVVQRLAKANKASSATSSAEGQGSKPLSTGFNRKAPREGSSHSPHPTFNRPQYGRDIRETGSVSAPVRERATSISSTDNTTSARETSSNNNADNHKSISRAASSGNNISRRNKLRADLSDSAADKRKKVLEQEYVSSSSRSFAGGIAQPTVVSMEDTTYTKPEPVAKPESKKHIFDKPKLKESAYDDKPSKNKAYKKPNHSDNYKGKSYDYLDIEDSPYNQNSNFNNSDGIDYNQPLELAENISIITVKENKVYDEHLNRPDTVKSEHTDVPSALSAGFRTFIKHKKHKRHKKHTFAKAKLFRTIEISDKMSAQDVAYEVSEKVKKVINVLQSIGVNDVQPDTILDVDTIELAVTELGHKCLIIEKDSIINEVNDRHKESKGLTRRQPVVTIMGHVDHGKTSILDALRKASVTSGEKGGITQHIGAYQYKDSKENHITFIDTPGHEAFSAMRERGSNITDIVVLVVAADDSVKVQTIESIKHAKKAGVPIIVAINKVDKPDANVEKVKSDLLQQEIVLEQFGGDIMSIEVSALKNINLDGLVEAILLTADMIDLECAQDVMARGVILEVCVVKGKGTSATVLVTEGTLNKGDIFATKISSAKVKSIVDENNMTLNSLSAGKPALISGFMNNVDAGDEFIVARDDKEATLIVDYLKRKDQPETPVAESSVNIEDLFKLQSSSAPKIVNLIVKADTAGSIEAILDSIAKITHDEVTVNILHSGVGPVVDSDVSLLANASNSNILIFNVNIDSIAKISLKKYQINCIKEPIIYDALDALKGVMSDLLDPDIKEEIIGSATVQAVFEVSGVGSVAGSMVDTGIIKLGEKASVMRGKTEIISGTIEQLKRFKEDAKQVQSGQDCGIVVAGYKDIQVGDIIKCIKVDKIRKFVD